MTRRRIGSVDVQGVRRRAFSYRGLLLALASVLVVLTVAWTLLPGMSEEKPPMTFPVRRGPFIHEIIEKGEIESANNVEVRCKVKAQGSWGRARGGRGGRSFGGGGGLSAAGGTAARSAVSGYTILEIVPEGTNVETGDVLVILDSSALEDQQVSQEIRCSGSEASVTEARNRYETALMALQQYVDATFQERRQSLADSLFRTREFLRRAQQDVKYSQELFATGYVTKLQVEANQYALEKAQKDVDAATTELVCLEKYTRQKRTKDLEAAIETAMANRDSSMQSHEVNVRKLETIKDQIAHCTIKAPQAGQVVYANRVGMRMMGAEIILEAGTVVRENQVLIRLPDPQQMQVKVMVDEDNVALVEVGQPATMRMDAFPDLQLNGRVTKVNQYAAPSSGHSFMANFRRYETTVAIDNPPPELRPGLTAEVRIRIARINDVLLVPSHVVIDHGPKQYCLLERGGQWEAREIEVGSTNDKFVIIRKGLNEGEPVVMGAARYLDKVALPELPDTNEEGDKAAGDRTSGEDDKKDASEAGKAGGGPPRGNRPGPGGGPAGSNRAGQGGFDPAAIFQRLDADGDGKLSGGETPAQMKSRTPSLDANGDGSIDRAEWTAAMKQRPPRRGGQGGGPRGGQGGGPRGRQGGGQGGGPGGRRPGMGRPPD